MANKIKDPSITTFSIKDAFSYGWETFKKRPWYFIVFSLIIIGVNIIPSILGGPDNNNQIDPWKLIILLLGSILSWITTLGTINFVLKIYDNKPAPYSSIFEKWKLVFSFFVASILFGLIIFGGLILLIIPGIIWSLKFQFFPYAMVDRGTGIIESLKLSAKITDNNKWNILLFNIMQGLVLLLGFLLLGIGVLAALPITSLAEAYVYRKLSAGK